MGKMYKTTKERALIKAEGKARWKTKRFFFRGEGWDWLVFVIWGSGMPQHCSKPRCRKKSHRTFPSPQLPQSLTIGYGRRVETGDRSGKTLLLTFIS